MPDNLILEVEAREPSSKNAVRRMRANARIPAIVYGAERDPALISLADRDVAKAMQTDTFFSQIIDLKLDSVSQQVVIRDLQRHPANQQVLHIDFMRIREDRALQVSIPIRFENEDRCVGVRLGGGIISHNLIEVEVSCLPRNLPEFLSVDVEHLELHDTVHLSSLNLPEGVEVVALMQGDLDRDIPVVSVQPPKGTMLGEEEEAVGDFELDQLEESAGDLESKEEDDASG